MTVTSKLCRLQGFDLMRNKSLSFLFVLKSVLNLQKNTIIHVILLLNWQ